MSGRRRTGRPAFWVAFLGLALLSLSGQRCPAGEDTPRREASVFFETTLTLQDSTGKATTQFDAGEPMTLVMTIRNRTDTPRSIMLPSSQSYDCSVSTAEGREVWRWAKGVMFAQVITELKLAPGETKSYSQVWDQKADDGTMIPAGRYRAIGLIPVDAPGTHSAPIVFTIRP